MVDFRVIVNVHLDTIDSCGGIIQRELEEDIMNHCYESSMTKPLPKYCGYALWPLTTSVITFCRSSLSVRCFATLSIEHLVR